jgi:hypothetical protein
VGQALEQEGAFAAHVRIMPEADRAALTRIMGDLHSKMERNFLPVRRPKA